MTGSAASFRASPRRAGDFARLDSGHSLANSWGIFPGMARVIAIQSAISTPHTQVALEVALVLRP